MFKAERKESSKIKFINDNFNKIVQLEKSLYGILKQITEEQIKKSELDSPRNTSNKVSEGKGMIQFMDVFKLQKCFEDEKLFMMALTFIKRVEILQDNEKKYNTNKILFSGIFIKVSENSEEGLKDLISKSVFKDHIFSLEFSTEKENAEMKFVKIKSELSSVISGLRAYLQDSELISDMSDFLNINSKPFIPKQEDQFEVNNQLARSSSLINQVFAIQNVSSKGKEKKTELDYKREISQMYQYYNYLLFDKNKENLSNEVDRKAMQMKYTYDEEVKSSYLAVQAPPDVIKAAIGIDREKSLPFAERGPYNHEFNKIEKSGAPIQVDSESEKKQTKDSSLSLKSQVTKYSTSQIATILQSKNSQIKSPLSEADRYEIKKENREYLESILNKKPKVCGEQPKQKQYNLNFVQKCLSNHQMPFRF